MAYEVPSDGKEHRLAIGKLPMWRKQDEVIRRQAGFGSETQRNGPAHRKANQRRSLGSVPDFFPRRACGVQPLFCVNAAQSADLRPKARKQDPATGDSFRGQGLGKRSHVSRRAQKTMDQEDAGLAFADGELAMIWMGIENVTHTCEPIDNSR